MKSLRFHGRKVGRSMKILKAIGRILIAIGLLALICGGVWRTTLEIKRDLVIVQGVEK